MLAHVICLRSRSPRPHAGFSACLSLRPRWERGVEDAAGTLEAAVSRDRMDGWACSPLYSTMPRRQDRPRARAGLLFPSGNAPDPERCNTYARRITGTTRVGSYGPRGQSPYLVADMVGNV
jgi:hypothetical protein